MKFSHSSSDIRQLCPPRSQQTDICSWINPSSEPTVLKVQQSNRHSCNQGSTWHFHRTVFNPLSLVPLIYLTWPVCFSPRCATLRTTAATTTLSLIFSNESLKLRTDLLITPGQRHRFYTNDKEFQATFNNRGSARCCPRQENNFLVLNFNFCSSSLQGYGLLLIEEKRITEHRRKYISQWSCVKTKRLFLAIHSKCEPGNY